MIPHQLEDPSNTERPSSKGECRTCRIFVTPSLFAPVSRVGECTMRPVVSSWWPTNVCDTMAGCEA
jgi:hypothetical protein